MKKEAKIYEVAAAQSPSVVKRAVTSFFPRREYSSWGSSFTVKWTHVKVPKAGKFYAAISYNLKKILSVKLINCFQIFIPQYLFL